MKRSIPMFMLLVAIAIMALIFAPTAKAASNVFYTVTLSTPICDVGGISWKGAKTPNINLANVRVKQIWIHNVTSTSTALVSVYKNAVSTGAASLVVQYVVPGTVGTYTVFPNELSSTLSNADLYNMPYLGIGIDNDTLIGNNTVGTIRATIKYLIP